MNVLDLIRDVDAILHDGYTLDGYIGEVKGVHGALHFTYRPIDPVTRGKMNLVRSQVVNNGALSEEQKEMACQVLNLQLIAAGVKSWDLVDDKGESVAPSAHALLRHFPDYRLRRLIEIVSDGLPSDQKPSRSTSEPPDRSTGDLEAAAKN